MKQSTSSSKKTLSAKGKKPQSIESLENQKVETSQASPPSQHNSSPALQDNALNAPGAAPTHEPVFSPREEINPPLLEDDKMDNTEVYDEGDLASAYERGFIQDAINKHKEKLQPETHPDFDGENCVACGNPIPSDRLALRKIRCVKCQEALEKRKKQYA